jgi:hypothetical protein
VKPLRHAALAFLLLALTCAVTYPQVRFFHRGVNDFGDPLLNAWALAWVPHAISTQPAAIFDANIFHPDRGTLALSETLIFPALLVAPLRAAGASAIDLHNVTLFSGYVLSGLTMFLLVSYITGEAAAAVFAAILFTITPLRAEHYPRVQAQMTYLLPLALLCLYRVLDRARGHHDRSRAVAAGLLGLCIALQFYSCVYYALFLCTLLPVTWLFSAALSPPPRDLGIRYVGAAALVAAILVLPATPAYLSNERAVGQRSMDEVRQGSATVRDYLRVTPSNWFYNGYPGGTAERHLFTGYVRAATAVAAVMAPIGRWLPIAASALVAWDISLGVNGRLYRPLYTAIFPYRALRVPARMAMVLDLLVSLLAGIGCAQLLKRLRSPRLRVAIVIVLSAGALLESVNRPFELREMDKQTPAVYEWLSTAPGGPILEYPTDGLEGRIGPQDATYMYFSTAHWRPLLNGYSGFAPPRYRELLGELQAFPSRGSLDYLRGRGVRYLLLHERYYLRGGFDEDVEMLSHAAGLVPKATFQDHVTKRSVVFEFAR